MTVMLFQYEGSDETLQEGFRTINNAIDKMANSVVRILPPPAAKGLTTSKDGLEPDQDVVDAEFEHAADDAVSTPSASQPKRKERGGNSRTPPQPKVLDLDLKAGAIPLRDYLEQRKPANHSRKCLLIAAWMKNNLNLNEIGINHIYTAYRHMNWVSPRDVGAPLRSMKSQNGWFAKGSIGGTYAINHVGLDQAERSSGN